MTDVFLVHHVHQLPDSEEDVKLLGVFSSEARAVLAIDRARNLPGFSEAPDGFSVDKYQIDKSTWTEGFLTWGQTEDKGNG
ncbi:hypothetical protein [Variovorax sp. YR750]|uniref:DUF7336 domain-containing protein n=1 Tax=Variovorax sp. YR750 TaxID=1884384 RepID=UPI000B813EF3|nr:hypothetical protein [Variovorax sp. YR750]